LELAEAKRLRALERENAALKRHVGERTLDNRRLKKLIGKNWCAWLPNAAVYLERPYGVSERRACRVLSLHRSTKRR
jgi:hypothetical protein